MCSGRTQVLWWSISLGSWRRSLLRKSGGNSFETLCGNILFLEKLNCTRNTLFLTNMHASIFKHNLCTILQSKPIRLSRTEPVPDICWWFARSKRTSFKGLRKLWTPNECPKSGRQVHQARAQILCKFYGFARPELQTQALSLKLGLEGCFGDGWAIFMTRWHARPLPHLQSTCAKTPIPTAIVQVDPTSPYNALWNVVECYAQMWL